MARLPCLPTSFYTLAALRSNPAHDELAYVFSVCSVAALWVALVLKLKHKKIQHMIRVCSTT